MNTKTCPLCLSPGNMAYREIWEIYLDDLEKIASVSYQVGCTVCDCWTSEYETLEEALKATYDNL